MISSASEKELDIANIRADIMIALNEKYSNYDLLNKLDKYQENEKQKLISFIRERIKIYEENIENSKLYLKHKELFNQVQNDIHTSKCIITNLKDILDFINKGGKDE